MKGSFRFQLRGGGACRVLAWDAWGGCAPIQLSAVSYQLSAGGFYRFIRRDAVRGAGPECAKKVTKKRKQWLQFAFYSL
jgi:hypothetical protein